MELVRVPAGRFAMGSPDGERERDRDEGPRSAVRIERPFWMGIHEVTQRQYEAVAGRNPSHFRGETRPVERVSWNDAVEFCRMLSARTGRKARLPTEAEWEDACRAGTTTRFSFGDSYADLHRYGNYADRSAQGFFHADPEHDDGHAQTAPVGSYRPNAFGLHDMHGNVSEYCADVYRPRYDAPPAPEPKDPVLRVIRGGAWCDPARFCRSADRNARGQTSGGLDYGFRIVVEADP